MLVFTMELASTHSRARDTFASALERYLRTMLHDNAIRVNPIDAPKSLPVFLERTYKFYQCEIAGRRCVFPTTRRNDATPAEIAKHIALVRSIAEAVVIFAAPSLSGHNRARLIAQGVAFVVPGNQLYVPELAVDLREHFRALKSRSAEGLTPAAQAVLFYHLLRADQRATTPTAIARHLHYSPMSIGRAFENLVAIGLAKTERKGKETHLEFNAQGRELFEAARTFLRNPVRAVKYIQTSKAASTLKLAGETALAELTDLSPPQMDTYAIGAANWKSFAQKFNISEVDETGECAVETWSYDPAILSNARVVDPLSLYAQFWNARDERISKAADKLLESVAW
jgi:DNA-binding MarR family transcriptional regulator